MREQRTCQACGGSGQALAKHLDFDCPYHTCPVCAGRGTVDAKASREDALADAATIDAFVVASRATRGAKYEFGLAISDADFYGRRAHKAWNPHSAAVAARAAFRACPMLRGE